MFSLIFLQEIRRTLQGTTLGTERDILSIFLFHEHAHDDVLPLVVRFDRLLPAMYRLVDRLVYSRVIGQEEVVDPH